MNNILLEKGREIFHVGAAQEVEWGEIRILIDKRTGVEYVCIHTKDGGVSITPRLKRDGSVVVDNI